MQPLYWLDDKHASGRKMFGRIKNRAVGLNDPRDAGAPGKSLARRNPKKLAQAPPPFLQQTQAVGHLIGVARPDSGTLGIERLPSLGNRTLEDKEGRELLTDNSLLGS